MTKRMLIDAVHAEETRVVVVDGQRIEELDFESQSRKQLRGNIYLAKVTRVEPSLQAAFIEYGGNRHGFLAFNEIHPDYYQIPVADREALLREEAEDDDDPVHVAGEGDASDDEDDVMEQELERRRRRLMRRYKIQEVIRRRQIMLVQVVKEERGNKGAALTTYLSLAGRYCVLMPNTARGGGISRKITSAPDRKRLKSMAQGLDVPHGMGLIIRTAGAKRTKVEIKRDYEYLLRMWEVIRETTLQSIAPSLIYAEEDLVKRAIRDMYDKDLDGILVEGEAGYREARDFMRMLMPSQAKKIQLYRDATPLFVRHRIEDQLAQIHSPVVPLPSGGYIVINQTEALVAVDVNSGKATRERNVESTALKTNLEAAEETARQLRLRDLAGLIVIDFIDMEEAKNNRAVEKTLKDCLSDDRARVQMGKISPFGLMEISRQRRRSGVLEGTTHVCEHCQGTGRVRSVESSALAALRAIETEFARGGGGAVTVRLATAVALYVLNEKRAYLAQLEESRDLLVTIITDEDLAHADVDVERTETREGVAPREIESLALPVISITDDDDDDDDEDDDADADGEDDAEAFEGRDGVDDGLDDQSDLSNGEVRAAPVAGSTRSARDRNDTAGEDEGQRRRRRRRRGRRDDGGDLGAPSLSEPDAELTSNVDDLGQGASFDFGDEQSYGAGTELESDGHRKRRRRGRRGGRRLREEPRPADLAADPYAWVHAHGGQETRSDAEDPYAWRDPHSPDASAQDRALDAEAERVLAREGARSVAPKATTSPDRASQANAGQTEAGPSRDPYQWRDSVGGDNPDRPDDQRDRPRRGRGRRGRNRPERNGPYGDPAIHEAVMDESAADATPADISTRAEDLDPRGSSERPLPLDATPDGPGREASQDGLIGRSTDVPGSVEDSGSNAVTEPFEAADAPEPVEPAPELVGSSPPLEPDPAEISSPPAAPRRGWWRRLG